MNTVQKVARMTGISVRTLHYYDQIGLLTPTSITEAGYRLYGEDALERLQQILFFRELDFPLGEIQKILDAPSFDPKQALEQHRSLLKMKRDRLNSLIGLVDDLLKGEKQMSFQEFDTTPIEQARQKYAEEAEQRWGDSASYRESQKKTSAYGKEDWARITAEADKIYAAFAANMGEEPSSPAVKDLVRDWQQHITRNYYQCTNEILAGLGQMYTADERFTQSIDAHAPGLAAFMSAAISAYTGL